MEGAVLNIALHSDPGLPEFLLDRGGTLLAVVQLHVMANPLAGLIPSPHRHTRVQATNALPYGRTPDRRRGGRDGANERRSAAARRRGQDDIQATATQQDSIVSYFFHIPKAFPGRMWGS